MNLHKASIKCHISFHWKVFLLICVYQAKLQLFDLKLITHKQALFWIILLCSTKSFAQDIHLSQFYNSPMNLNPALTGIFPEDIRFIANYREQWSSVPVPYLTFSGAYDTKIFSKLAPNGFFSVGGVFNYDKQGTGELRLTQLSLAGSYTHQVGELSFLSLGLQMGSINRRFNMDGLTFENQYNGDVFDPNLDPRENFQNTSKTFLDFGTGLNYYFQSESGFDLNIGGALFHLSKPDQSFFNQTSATLPFRMTGHLAGKAPLNPKMDLKFRLLGQFQGPYQEFLLGSALLYKLNDSRGKAMSLSLGTNFRYAGESDAIIPTVGFQYLSWYAELSYDINISQFKQATNGAGGPELALIYTITKVKPPKAFKACPIF